MAKYLPLNLLHLKHWHGVYMPYTNKIKHIIQGKIWRKNWATLTNAEAITIRVFQNECKRIQKYCIGMWRGSWDCSIILWTSSTEKQRNWVLFTQAKPNIPPIEAIRFFKRFIDDCIGMWRGSKRSFDNFVNRLSREAAKFRIKYPLKEIQLGKSVDFLDLTVYLGDDNTIQYKGYTKPTDAKRYLKMSRASIHDQSSNPYPTPRY